MDAYVTRLADGPLSAEKRRQAGISDGLIRFSVGLEEPRELIADIEQALG